MQEDEAFDINIIAGTCNDVIDEELALAAIICNAEPKRDAAVDFADPVDCCPGMNGHPAFDPLAKPPGSFGWQMVFDQVGPPYDREAMHRPRKMSERPGLWPTSERRNGRA